MTASVSNLVMSDGEFDDGAGRADKTESKTGVSIARLLRPHWKALGVALVAILAESAADILGPWPLKVIMDDVIGPKPLPPWLAVYVGGAGGSEKFTALHLAAGAVLLIAAVGAVSTYAEKYLTTSVGQRVAHDLRLTLYHHIQRLSLSFYEQRRTGDLLVRMTSDIDAVQDFVSTALLGIVVSALTLAGMVCVMLYLNWEFTLVALSVAPALFLTVYRLTRRIKREARAVKEKESEMASLVQESLSSIRVVKAFSREDYEERRLSRESLASVEAALRARGAKAKLAPAVDFIVAAGTCLVLWYGARLVLAGELTAGSLLVFFLYLGKMYQPMRDLSKMTDTLSKAAVGFERISEVLRTESQVRDLPGARAARRFGGRIEFERVTFGYEERVHVLRDVSLKVEPGQFAALVGPTGAGKSSLLGLVARLYDPLSGTVKIDDEDVRRFTLDSLRRQVSFVLQEAVLFRAPVWQNIAYGRPGASREEVVRAAVSANAHEFIERLPEGYDTVLGERGTTLSGGQRQLIAIARAVIRDAPILLMDEPSSGLDAASEELVFKALARLMKGKTCIVIAHRLATVRRADVIFVVNDGTLAESGTHAELLASGGLYSDLHEIQFRV
jgi:subfamily B ATP-binding cassette protein MsbA